MSSSEWRKVPCSGCTLQHPVKQEPNENNWSLFNKEIHWERAARAEPFSPFQQDSGSSSSSSSSDSDSEVSWASQALMQNAFPANQVLLRPAVTHPHTHTSCFPSGAHTSENIHLSSCHINSLLVQQVPVKNECRSINDTGLSCF